MMNHPLIREIEVKSVITELKTIWTTPSVWNGGPAGARRMPLGQKTDPQQLKTLLY